MFLISFLMLFAQQKIRKKSTVSTKSGFTLPEMIIAISVLVLVIVGSTNLLISIIRGNTENMHTFVAYELAQEGLEGFRNIRDSNWLLNADFDGALFEHKIWGETLPNVVGSLEFYTLDYNYLSNNAANLGQNIQVRASEMYQYAPWKLKKLAALQGKPDREAARLYIQKVSLANNTTQVRYVHDQNAGQEKSLFSRYIQVEAVPYDFGNEVEVGSIDVDAGAPNTKIYKYRITSVVTWEEFGRNKEVSLTTELTDWKGGPL